MRRGAPLVALTVAAVLALGTGASASGSSVTRATSLEAHVLREINAVRIAHGVRPLAPSQALSRAAAGHSRSMVSLGYFSHESKNGTPFADRVKRFYAARSRPWSVGENLAMFGGITPRARTIVSAWLQSPSHRANLMRAGFRDAGIAIVHHPTAGGIFGGESTWVVTLDLGQR
jgi:uncharacterized protein YkwD